MLGFIKSLVGVKADQMLQNGVQFLVRFDPKAATEAEIRQMEEQLDNLGRELAASRMTFERERKEAEAIQQLSAQRMAAAGQLEQQMMAEADPARKAGLEKSLVTLVDMLEKMTPDVERERRDAAEAAEFMELLESTYQDMGEKLRTARSELERAQRDMKAAEQRRMASERRAEAARRAAGLASATSGLSVALKAMREAAEEDLEVAEAARLKADLLQPTKPEEEDPNIAAALASVGVGASPAGTSVTSRLAMLRAKSGTAPTLPDAITTA